MSLASVNLVDLATFKIHVENSPDRCCACGASARGAGECLFADELCSKCWWITVKKEGRFVRRGRRETFFYRPSTVYVLNPRVNQKPLRIIWDGVPERQRAVTSLACMVKIDGVRYVGRPMHDSIQLLNTDGSMVRECGLQLSQEHLAKIYVAQTQSA